MSQILQLSEAALIALHAMAVIARSEELQSTGKIAKIIGASENHLSKVLQRLTKANFITSIRGPKGGFKLVRTPEEITLLDIYEVIEGKAEVKKCLVSGNSCPFGHCIFGNLNNKFYSEFVEYFKNKTLKDFM